MKRPTHGAAGNKADFFSDLESAADNSGSPKSRKMSFKEKFKRFTSPTPNRKSDSSGVRIGGKEKKLQL